MEEQLVSFKTAKLAKEIGFDTPVLYVFDDEDGYLTASYSESVFKPLNYNIHGGYKTSKPSQSLLQKWLREKHKIHINISVNQFGYGFMYALIDLKQCKCIKDLTGGPNEKYTYEKALEEALYQSLLLIK